MKILGEHFHSGYARMNLPDPQIWKHLSKGKKEHKIYIFISHTYILFCHLHVQLSQESKISRNIKSRNPLQFQLYLIFFYLMCSTLYFFLFSTFRLVIWFSLVFRPLFRCQKFQRHYSFNTKFGKLQLHQYNSCKLGEKNESYILKYLHSRLSY